MAALLIATAVSGCASTERFTERSGEALADHLPTWAGGEPARTPQRSSTPPQFLNIFEAPGDRDEKPLTVEEQKRLQSNLSATRDRVAAQGKSTNTPERDRKREAELAALRNRVAAEGAEARSSAN